MYPIGSRYVWFATAFLSAVMLVALSGCGGSAPAPAPTYISVNGNWQFNVEIAPAVPTLPSNPVGNVMGSLSSSGNKVTGILNVRPYGLTNCISETADLAATGTLDAAGNLALSAPIGTGTLTLMLNVSNTSNRFPGGSVQVVGGPCAQAVLPVDGYRVPTLTGTFTGTANPGPIGGTGSGPATLTVTLTQSTAPNADGAYLLSGTAVATGGCSYTLNFSSGLVAGDTFYNQPPALVFGGPPQIFLTGAITPGDGVTATSVIAGLNFTAPSPCTASAYSGVLDRQ
jgi:hypothetical protein